MSEDFFKCPCDACGSRMEVPKSSAGMTIECPHCHQHTKLVDPKAPVKLGIAIARQESPTPKVAAPVPSVTEMATQRHLPASKPRGKDWLTTFLFASFLGGLGVDRFYNGRVGLGVAKAVTCGGCGLWGLIDIIFLLTERYTDGSGNCLKPATHKHKKIAIIVFVISLLVGSLFSVWRVMELRAGLNELGFRLNE